MLNAENNSYKQTLDVVTKKDNPRKKGDSGCDVLCLEQILQY